MTRVAGLFVLACVVVSAQTETAQFDVVSIKRNISRDLGAYGGQLPGGRYTATNTPALSLVLSAYAIQHFQLVGAPDWLESERYDINAVAEGGLGNRDRLNAMLRHLLVDRFKLATHTETRTVVGYGLMQDRADGKLGPQLKAVSVDCDAVRAAEKAAPPPVRRTMADFLTPHPCSSFGGSGMFVTGTVTMDRFARELVTHLKAPVGNETALTGDYEVVLRWNPDPLSPNADQTLPSSLQIALREQLGLKLEPRPQPVEMVVIDRIERPTEN